jgi:hypothetical protein
MLRPSTTGYLASCDKCHRTVASIGAAEHDAASAIATSLGWFEAARKGRGREKWDWWCPSCRPQQPKTFGPSTSRFFPDPLARVAEDLAPKLCPSCQRPMRGETRAVGAGQAAIAWSCSSCPSS